MRKHFDDQIAQLGEQMMAMGALVENTIERAIRALQTDDMAEAAAIRDGDHIVDEKEREVEAMCIHMLLQQQPVARDLRTISAALKMITDMERIGDQRHLRNCDDGASAQSAPGAFRVDGAGGDFDGAPRD